MSDVYSARTETEESSLPSCPKCGPLLTPTHFEPAYYNPFGSPGSTWQPDYYSTKMQLPEGTILSDWCPTVINE